MASAAKSSGLLPTSRPNLYGAPASMISSTTSRSWLTLIGKTPRYWRLVARLGDGRAEFLVEHLHAVAQQILEAQQQRESQAAVARLLHDGHEVERRALVLHRPHRHVAVIVDAKVAVAPAGDVVCISERATSHGSDGDSHWAFYKSCARICKCCARLCCFYHAGRSRRRREQALRFTSPDDKQVTASQSGTVDLRAARGGIDPDAGPVGRESGPGPIASRRAR